MVNEAYFSVTGYVATQPRRGLTKNGTRTLYMRVGWTPRRIDTATGEWADQPSSFVSVQCFRKVAENAAACLRKSDPIVLKGTLRVREYADQAGVKRTSVDVIAESIGHDLSKGLSVFSKTPAQLEQTALEHEAAEAAVAGRAPLPGDRPDAASADQPGLEPAGRPDLSTGDDRSDLERGYRPDPESADEDERFDEEEDGDVLPEAAEAVGAAEPAARVAVPV